MALMFSRIARNFIKDGYFPTDECTLARISLALQPATSGQLNLLDPCCGEGAALMELKQALGPERCRTFGIELDHERHATAHGWLDRCLRSDCLDTVLDKRAWSCLFLNPPYGSTVVDKQRTGSSDEPKRQEEQFLERCTAHLMYDGVLVFIIPQYSLSSRVCKQLVHFYRDIRVFKAPEQRFKQIVVLAYRKRADSTGQTALVRLLQSYGDGTEQPPELPDEVWSEPYRVPAASTTNPTFFAVKIEPDLLAAEITRCGGGLWSQFDGLFNRLQLTERRPLCPLSPWHLALSLAAGQIHGVIRSHERILMVKGGTKKDKKIYTEILTDENGRSQERRIAQDVFVPVIRAIEFTPGPLYGELITIT